MYTTGVTSYWPRHDRPSVILFVVYNLALLKAKLNNKVRRKVSFNILSFHFFGEDNPLIDCLAF